MSQRQAAIDYFHELCTTGTLAQDTWDHLLPGLGARGLIFGTRPLTSVLRPLSHRYGLALPALALDHHS